MLNSEQMKAAMRQYVERLNAGDLDGVVSMFAADATVEDPVGTDIRRGTVEIRAFYEMAIASASKLTIVGPQRGSSGDFAARPLDVDVTLPGAPKMKIGVIETMRFNEAGQITAMQAFWGPEDMAS